MWRVNEFQARLDYMYIYMELEIYMGYETYIGLEIDISRSWNSCGPWV